MWILLATLLASAHALTAAAPTIDELIQLKSVSSPRISPDGSRVAYQVNTTDWKQDAFVSQIWIAVPATGRTFQLTRGEKSASQPRWSPDGKWLAFVTERGGAKPQVYAVASLGGEAVQLTKAENGVGGFEWSRDSRFIAYSTSDADEKADKKRKDHLGPFEVVRRDYHYTHIWTIDLDKALESPTAGTQRTKGRDFSVGSFSWSPDGTRIAFDASINPDLVQRGTADLYVLTLDSGDLRKLVSQPGPDASPIWSPDGSQIAFESAMGGARFFHANSRIAVVNASGGTPRALTNAFDENPQLTNWLPAGIHFSALQKTSYHLFRLDPATSRITRLTSPATLLAGNFSFTPDGSRMAYTTFGPKQLSEVYVSSVETLAPVKLTNMTAQASGHTLATREVITWKSSDGTPIDGILIKPANFDPTKQYPLLCIIHGGPTGIDLPSMVDTRYYPADIWAARGAVLLKVNYRGSAGYGEAFRQLNVRNLGVGDAWDVLSGVDHLVKQGFIDEKKMGCMGWSQGGYISAFLTTTSRRFAAISVGAGISNWATYYYNTDITPFTPMYLNDNPAGDPDIYRKTSPMTYIRQAATPTLIQHGEFDRRVPIPNGYELRQGLEDQKVPVEMVVYKGYGHGITKPKSMRAVMQHNLAWFNHYLFGDPLPEFAKPEIPGSATTSPEK
ncbi:MAG: S9 family peptidase [Acidobacteria bacterium]|nr:S9 family peptidase [Acidobacteriota bacterium]